MLKRGVEWPTIGVALAIHTGWLGVTWAGAQATLPLWAWPLLAASGGFLVAWHGSLQHEIIHGHPTRSRALNTLLASLPLGLWLPFGVYREQHVAHHRSPHLTDPFDDPESFYVTRAWWDGAGLVRRALARAQTTIVGRLVLGPPILVLRFLAAETRLIARGDRSHVRAWAAHLAGLAVVAAWLVLVCKMSPLRYVACFVYPGAALTLLRSYAEHRPADVAAHRVAIVEAGPLASLLYLNNNLHVVHHDEPALPWYELPARYAAERAAVLAANGGFVFRGYGEVVVRFAMREKDSPVHPAR